MQTTVNLSNDALKKLYLQLKRYVTTDSSVQDIEDYLVLHKIFHQDKARFAQIQGAKIEQIKAVRMLTNWGLKEAKDYVDLNSSDFDTKHINKASCKEYIEKYGDVRVAIFFKGESYYSVNSFIESI